MERRTDKRVGAEVIASFDRHFDGLDVKRIEPRASGGLTTPDDTTTSDFPLGGFM